MVQNVQAAPIVPGDPEGWFDAKQTHYRYKGSAAMRRSISAIAASILR